MREASPLRYKDGGCAFADLGSGKRNNPWPVLPSHPMVWSNPDAQAGLFHGRAWSLAGVQDPEKQDKDEKIVLYKEGKMRTRGKGYIFILFIMSSRIYY